MSGAGRRNVDEINAILAANTALTKITDHEKTCDQRYETIENVQHEIKDTVKALSDKVDKLTRNYWIGIGALIVIGKMVDYFAGQFGIHLVPLVHG